MPQIFHRSFNVVSRATIFGFVFILAGLGWFLSVFYRSSDVTGKNIAYVQPVPFSHAHHVGDLGIDCRYCHTSVEKGAYAGIPPTKTCMNCHQQIWVGSEVLKPVREAYQTGDPIHWQRVHNVPGYVYFNHSIHLSKGVGCTSCHGRVDKMHLVYQEHTLLMEWCLDCHRHPEKHVRPRDQVFNMAWQASDRINPETDQPYDQETLGKKLVKDYNIRSEMVTTSCSFCHR